MSHHAVYREILIQATAAVPEAPQASNAPGFTEASEELGDHLYRLCIEFGVSFNIFKAAVMGEALRRSRSRIASAGDSPQVPSFLDPIASQVPLIILALELMREDEAF